MEIAVVVFLALWVALYGVERSARGSAKLGRYAWVARAAKQSLLFGGTGLFLILAGTDWHNRPWEIAAGTILILIGLALSSWTCINRRRIQEGLRTGKIEPMSGEG